MVVMVGPGVIVESELIMKTGTGTLHKSCDVFGRVRKSSYFV